jgi:hypothetical protein
MGGWQAGLANAQSARDFAMKKTDEVALNEKEISKTYTQALRLISLSSVFSDQTRQYMADAVREFYGMLDAQMEAKRNAPKTAQSLSAETARAKVA